MLRIISGLLIVAALLVFSSAVLAQGSVTWGQPFNISASDTSSDHPAIVVDGYGVVHVFWTEDMNGRVIELDETPDPTNTILYCQWDGERWTEPLDILAVVGDPLADFVAATVDQWNDIHLVWTGLTQLYYSTAPASQAYSIKAWSAPQVISGDSARSRFETDVVVDSAGTVHVVYAARGSQAGVFHIMFAPNSSTWSTPNRISGFLRENEVAFNDVRLAVDDRDRLHAAWATANDNGYSQAVYYARSERAGEVWDEQVMLADATINTGFTGFPSLLAQGEDELLLIHVDERNKGRIERTSVDAGRTWSEPRFILSGMEGVNGFLIPLIDSAENLHLVINMRPSADQRVGIYYAPRAGLDWAPIIPVAVDEPYGPSAHYTDAVVRLGNEIHVVWTQLRSGEIWHVQGTINGVAPMSPQATPGPRPQPVATPSQSAGEPSSATPAPAAVTSGVAGPLPAELTALPDRATSILTPLIVAIVPVLLLVGGVVLVQAKRKR